MDTSDTLHNDVMHLLQAALESGLQFHVPTPDVSRAGDLIGDSNLNNSNGPSISASSVATESDQRYAHFALWLERRNRKLQEARAQQERERDEAALRECTFSPSFVTSKAKRDQAAAALYGAAASSESPSSAEAGASSGSLTSPVPLVARQEEWLRRRREKVEAAQREERQKEVAGCTFEPVISEHARSLPKGHLPDDVMAAIHADRASRSPRVSSATRAAGSPPGAGAGSPSLGSGSGLGLLGSPASASGSASVDGSGAVAVVAARQSAEFTAHVARAKAARAAAAARAAKWEAAHAGSGYTGHPTVPQPVKLATERRAQRPHRTGTLPTSPLRLIVPTSATRSPANHAHAHAAEAEAEVGSQAAVPNGTDSEGQPEYVAPAQYHYYASAAAPTAPVVSPAMQHYAAPHGYYSAAAVASPVAVAAPIPESNGYGQYSHWAVPVPAPAAVPVYGAATVDAAAPPPSAAGNTPGLAAHIASLRADLAAAQRETQILSASVYGNANGVASPAKVGRIAAAPSAFDVTVDRYQYYHLAQQQPRAVSVDEMSARQLYTTFNTHR